MSVEAFRSNWDISTLIPTVTSWFYSIYSSNSLIHEIHEILKF